jgi:hypothetical protein
MGTTVFWNVALRSLIQIDRRFRGVYRIHYQAVNRLMLNMLTAVITETTYQFRHTT